MKSSTLKLFVKDAFKSLRRNKTLTLASILTVALTMIILGSFLLISRSVDSAVSGLQDKMDIQVYLKNDITDEQKNAIESKIKTIDGIKEIKFISKDEAYKRMEEMMGKNKDMIEGLKDENVFPASFSVNIASTTQLDTLKSYVTTMPGVDSVKDGDETVSKFQSFKNLTTWVSVGLAIVLFGVSLFLIGNTIKLTVFSRRKEISIMKNIGATDWFIRWPFLIEGMILGFSGAIISILALYGFYSVVYNKITDVLLVGALISPSYIISALLPIFVAFGILLGSIGSIVSMRKFLNV